MIFISHQKCYGPTAEICKISFQDWTSKSKGILKHQSIAAVRFFKITQMIFQS